MNRQAPRSGRAARLGAWLSVTAGAMLALFGGALVYGYVSEAVVARIGEGDQSLLFWYLPFLLFGGPTLILGIGLIVWGTHAIRTRRRAAR